MGCKGILLASRLLPISDWTVIFFAIGSTTLSFLLSSFCINLCKYVTWLLLFSVGSHHLIVYPVVVTASADTQYIYLIGHKPQLCLCTVSLLYTLQLEPLQPNLSAVMRSGCDVVACPVTYVTLVLLQDSSCVST